MGLVRGADRREQGARRARRVVSRPVPRGVVAQHNDANVLSMGGRVVAPAYAREIVRVWLATGFEGGRHVLRLEQIASIERGEL